MRRRGVPADEVTMNSIIDGLVSCSPPRVREAETVLALMSGWGLKPNQARTRTSYGKRRLEESQKIEHGTPTPTHTHTHLRDGEETKFFREM